MWTLVGNRSCRTCTTYSIYIVIVTIICRLLQSRGNNEGPSLRWRRLFGSYDCVQQTTYAQGSRKDRKETYTVTSFNGKLLISLQRLQRSSLFVIILQYANTSYPDISNTIHEFDVLLQFDTTYELVEFLATMHIKVSLWMAEEHAERQMIECALTQRRKAKTKAH